jgi:2-polyprenyl-3-methyl-5-hydroxy-6-metoxy-1,4-benzoquinol methylase
MLVQTVRAYTKSYTSEVDNTKTSAGDSASPKGMIFHILKQNKLPANVLDIGFGTGQLARLIKSNQETQHWEIDGIDGWEPNCKNSEIIEKRLYRNIWHGFAHELNYKLDEYDIICILDVIEHLDSENAKWLIRSLFTHMNENAYLFISTPLWFYPQNQQQQDDLEEHLIGVPASSMMALSPVAYSINHPLIGGFVYKKSSIDLLEFFQPTMNRRFTIDKGLRIVKALNMNYQPGVITFLNQSG